jgi:hypothetical protein
MQRNSNHDMKKDQELQMVKQELNTIKHHQEQKLDQLSDGNNELIKQRRALLDKVEKHTEER